MALGGLLKLDVLKHFLPLTRYPYVGRQIACPVCGEPPATPIAGLDRRLKRLPTVACPACGLLFTNPMPTEAELETYYEQLYRFDYQMAAQEPSNKHVRKRTNEAEGRIADLEGLLPANARTLDFGCGSGELVEQLTALAYDAHGFEPGTAYGQYARRKLGERIRIACWQAVDYAGPFDLVSCFHVLEHLRDPIAALQRIVQWLKPAGLAYLEVPDMGIRDRNKGFGGLHFAHVLGFNHYNLLLAAAIVGLQPKRVISGTGIIFQKGDVQGDTMASQDGDLARKGARLTAELYSRGEAYRNYLRYQASKFRLRRRAS
ncbi:MAG: class I SAM-dependent methyltransferase [Pirellulales bacterium]|nr:class I SAM-dependent methyltransferase [Pirellulales bacterium]